MDLKIRRAVEILHDDGVMELSEKIQSRLRAIYAKRRGVRKLREGPLSVRPTYETERQRSLVDYFEKTERAILRDVLTELRPDDVFLDVGANQGVYSLFADQIASEVIAVEPYPPNRPTLRKNIRLNHATIDVLPMAFSNEDGETEFVNSGPEVDASVGIATGDDTETITVETVSGDRLVRTGDIPQPTVVKIDVEGAESLVIDGMKETLQNESCRVLYCEIHQDNWYGQSIENYGETPDELKTELSAMGFEIVPLEEIKNQYVLKCEKTSSQ